MADKSYDDYMIDIDDLYKRNMDEYKESFKLQSKIQEEEIGCIFPIEEYGSHRLLLKAVSLPETLPSGIIVPEAVREALIKKYNIGRVIGAGPDAFMRRDIFPTGPRCKIGDWISFSRFDKTDEIFNDYLCYIIHDDKVNWPIGDAKKCVSELRRYSS